MTRLVKRTITVEKWQGNRPRTFWDGKVLHEIMYYIDMWVETGSWWDGEEMRRMLRVYTHLQQVFDLEESQGNWMIYKVWD